MHVGPWGWRRIGGRWHFYWTGEWLSFGGLAGSTPKQGRPSIRREAIRILGGPFASLLMAIPGVSQGYQKALFRPFFHNPLPNPDQSILTNFSMIWGVISAMADVFHHLAL